MRLCRWWTRTPQTGALVNAVGKLQLRRCMLFIKEPVNVHRQKGVNSVLEALKQQCSINSQLDPCS